MIMAFVMLFLWQDQGDRYKGAFDTTVQAYYQGSEVKQYVDNATDRFKKEYPSIATTAPVVYAVGVRREIKFASKRLSPLPDSVASYQYNHATHSGSAGISWSF